MALWGMYGPSSQGLITRLVGRERQGTLQGAFASVQMATGIVGPRVFSEIFARAIDPPAIVAPARRAVRRVGRAAGVAIAVAIKATRRALRETIHCGADIVIERSSPGPRGAHFSGEFYTITPLMVVSIRSWLSI